MLEKMKLEKNEIALLVLLAVFYLAGLLGQSDIGLAFVFRAANFSMLAHTWFLLTIPFGTVSLYRILIKGEASHLAILINVIWFVTMLLELKWIVTRFIEAFEWYGRDRYVYNTLTQIMNSSRLLGRGMTAADIKYILPEPTTTMMFSNIMAQCGIAVAVALAVVIAVVLIAIIVRGRNQGIENKLMIMASCATLLVMLILNILINLRVLPPVSVITFIPFASGNIGHVIVSICLLGIAVWSGLKRVKKD